MQMEIANPSPSPNPRRSPRHHAMLSMVQKEVKSKCVTPSDEELYFSLFNAHDENYPTLFNFAYFSGNAYSTKGVQVLDVIAQKSSE